jgi:hypothetical protein
MRQDDYEEGVEDGNEEDYELDPNHPQNDTNVDPLEAYNEGPSEMSGIYEDEDRS